MASSWALIARRSLATYLDADAEEIFDVTAACLDRYHELFGIRYPFGKYDQAFVPEFNAGAMENPGCVTFRDEFLFRSAVTEADREIRAIVIAHEMAHMWFGDLVTLRWWDDIWLNESFAEYMGVRVTAEATRFTNAWTTFSVGRKGTGYAADQRPSTHPVAPEAIADAEAALLNFDGISYAKGASALRQLVAWIGDEPFLRGLRGHFDAHIHGNATLEDLLTALSRSSGRDLRSWAEVWLRTPGVSTLRPEIELDDDGRYRRVTVVQTVPDEYPILRPHRIGIGLYAGDGSGRLIRRVDVDLDPERDAGRTDIVALAGSEAPGLLLLNDGDLTFAKIRFDPGSRSRLVEVLRRSSIPLLERSRGPPLPTRRGTPRWRPPSSFSWWSRACRPRPRSESSMTSSSSPAASPPTAPAARRIDRLPSTRLQRPVARSSRRLVAAGSSRRRGASSAAPGRTTLRRSPDGFVARTSRTASRSTRTCGGRSSTASPCSVRSGSPRSRPSPSATRAPTASSTRCAVERPSRIRTPRPGPGS